jgi:hypothetical protein
LHKPNFAAKLPALPLPRTYYFATPPPIPPRHSRLHPDNRGP